MPWIGPPRIAAATALLRAVLIAIPSVMALAAGDENVRIEAALAAGDYRSAAEILRGFAEAGRTDAQFALASLYLTGRADAADPGDAVRWFERAAASGDDNSAFMLGIIYDKAIAVARDHGKALRWYEEAALAGNRAAQNVLGALYRSAGRMTLAADYSYRAAEQGLADAQLRVAEMFALGEGVASDDVAAYAWATIATTGDTTQEVRDAANSLLSTLALRMPAADRQEAGNIAHDWPTK